jgi:cytochrome c
MQGFRVIRTLVFSLSLCAVMVGAQPAQTQFKTTLLMSNINDPMQMAFLPNGKIYVATKSGSLRLFDPTSKTTTVAATIAVSNLREDGLQSVILDPKFATNRFVYLLFGVTTPSAAQVVARFTAQPNDLLDLSTRKDLLTIPYTISQNDEHNTGCLAFDTKGNLFIGLADNTNGFYSGATNGSSPRDPARPNYDSQRSAANSNDLRGKILRIHPEADGTYTIPAGNLFLSTEAKTRPEIYTMGNRHPFRITIDPKTDWLYWGEPGPNAKTDDPNQGPRGYDVIDLAKSPGNYAWPYCRGNVNDSNFCYKTYNYTTDVGGARYNPKALKNTSANNTGITDLPPGRPSLVWYPYNSIGTAFPIFGSGNNTNTSMVGFLYRFDPSLTSTTKIPKYYDQHLFIFDFSRSLIHAVQMNDTGGVVGVKRFWDLTSPGSDPIENTIDLKIGPDGALYFLNWSDNGAYHDNASMGNLIRLDYVGPPDPVTPRGKNLSPTKVLLVSQVGNLEVTLPPSATCVDFFDLKGVHVWNYERSAPRGTEVFSLPATLPLVVKMKFRFE